MKEITKDMVIGDILDADAGTDSRPYNYRFLPDVFTDGVIKGVHYLRHYAGDNNIPDFIQFHAAALAELHQMDTVFIAGPLRLSGYAVSTCNSAVRVNKSHCNICISDINCQ